MISNNDILDAIEALVAEAFPQEKVYRNYQPADFERPSNLLELSGGKGYPNFSCRGVELRPKLTLTTFVPVDAYHHGDTAQLACRQMRLLGLFLPGYVKVKDRAPHVEDEMEMDNGLDYASIAVTLSYTLSREDFMELQRYETMQALHIRAEVTTHG